MTLEDFDYLSPSITFFHYGRKNHSSKIGGVLTITGILISIAYILYLLTDAFSYKSLSLLFYKKFEYESGKYIFDNEGIFHFINLYSVNNNGYFGKFDKKYIRIFISRIAKVYPKNENSLSENDHWVYDLCDNNDKLNMDINLFDKIPDFTNASCIKYYYNSKTKNYYNKNQKEFIYPFIEHGNARKDNTLLGILIEECQNNTIFDNILGPCATQNDIKKYLNEFTAFYFSFIDNQVDPTNLKKPITKYFNTISSSLSKTKYSIHNINFNPLVVKTDKGLLKKKYINDKSFMFDYNREDSTVNKGNSNILAEISFWVENNFIIYDRSYNKIINILPTIGGIIEILYYIFYFINWVYNKYTILLHTKDLFLKIYTGRELNLADNELKKDTFIQKFTCMLSENKIPVSKFAYLSQKNAVFSTKNKVKNSIVDSNVNIHNIISTYNHVFDFNNTSNLKFIPNQTSKNNYGNLKTILTKSKNNTRKAKNSAPTFIYRMNTNRKQTNIEEMPRYNAFEQEFKKYIRKNKLKVKCPNRKIPLIENKFSFITFISSFFHNKNKNYGVDIFELFRKKLLSEEHLYRAHVNLYLLVKYFDIEQEKTDILELYKNL